MLLGASPAQEVPQTTLWIGALGAVLAYALTARAFHAVRLAIAAAAAVMCAECAAGCLTAAYHLAFGPQANHAYCATLRTSVLAMLALLLAWAASRWKYPELSRLIYPVMILGAYRLIAQDLHEEKAALFVSLLVYGALLTALPRLKRRVSDVTRAARVIRIAADRIA